MSLILLDILTFKQTSQLRLCCLIVGFFMQYEIKIEKKIGRDKKITQLCNIIRDHHRKKDSAVSHTHEAANEPFRSYLIQ